MENLLNTIAKNLQESIATAADKAGELTRVARVRLDVASSKKHIYRTQAALGAFVHQQLSQGEGTDHDRVRELAQKLDELTSELAAHEEALAQLQRQQAIQTADESPEEDI